MTPYDAQRLFSERVIGIYGKLGNIIFHFAKQKKDERIRKKVKKKRKKNEMKINRHRTNE